MGFQTSRSNNNPELMLLLHSSIYKQILKTTAESSMIESVGLGFGTQDGTIIQMRNFILMDNLDNSMYSFSLDYEILLKEIEIHEKKGARLLGFFHTHPEKASIYPSEKDRYYMNFWPYPYIWMIAGVEEFPELRIFSLFKGKIVEIPFRISKKRS
ncbi:MAG: Mov34/MPN/PAD-1 family protein [Candidatus Hodarchaeota archaeon]